MSNTRETFFKDYSNLLSEAEALTKNKDGAFSKYVTLKEVLTKAKELCKKNNFIFYQTINGGHLETTLEHHGGQKIVSKVRLVRKDYDNPQALGGSITYMRRYSLTAMLGIMEEDDDAEGAAQVTKNEL